MINDFIFDGRQLSDFGYIAIFEGSQDEVDVSVMQYEEIKAALSDISYKVSHSYENNLTSTFHIMKDPCEFYDEDSYMTNDEISELTKWLARKQYKWFRFIDEDDNDEIWYKAQFQVKKEFVGDKVVGLILTLNTNAPYGFTREFVNKYEIREASPEPYKIIVASDEEGQIFPGVKIISKSSQDFSLTIEFNGKQIETKIDNCVADEEITLGGENLQISSSVDHDFTTDFNYVFPCINNLYGNSVNTLYFGDGNYDIELAYRGIRKVGLI